MTKDKPFSVLSTIPKSAITGMHPATKRIIQQIKNTRGKVLKCRLKNSREGKNRLDALRRARKRGHIKYMEAHREGGTIYFRLR